MVFKRLSNYRRAFPFDLVQLSHEMDLNFLSDSYFKTSMSILSETDLTLAVQRGSSPDPSLH